jgi:hypothetical protein
VKGKYLNEDSVMKQGTEKRSKRKGSQNTEKGQQEDQAVLTGLLIFHYPSRHMTG